MIWQFKLDHTQMGEASKLAGAGSLPTRPGRGQPKYHPKRKSIARIMNQIVPTARMTSPTPGIPKLPHICLAPSLPTTKKAANQRERKRSDDKRHINSAILSTSRNLADRA